MEIPYKIRNSKRAKRMSLVINPDGSVVAVKPFWVKEKSLHYFVEKNMEWLKKTLNKVQIIDFDKNLHIYSRRHYLKYKEQARQIITQRTQELSRVVGLPYNKISIRNQKTRWGSCSESRNLSFNYKLIFHEPEIMDYIIIHELCHLEEMNHGSRFWSLVEKWCPRYRNFEAKLRGKLD